MQRVGYSFMKEGRHLSIESEQFNKPKIHENDKIFFMSTRLFKGNQI
jgi:hypothetical protein